MGVARSLAAIAIAASALLACHAAPTRPVNLVLVTVDTLRADHLGAYGDDRGLTPTLDRLAAHGLVFETAYSAAPFTLAAVTALMTARYPEELGIVSNDTVLPRDVPTLATALRAHGYRTGAVVSNFILRPAAGLDAGFEVYDATYPQKEAHREIPERVARATTDAALAVLERLTAGSRAPVFLWVHFQDPHGPYLPPDGLRAQYLPGERKRPDGLRSLPASADDTGIGGIPRYQLEAGRHRVAFYRAGYAGEIRYTDEQIARLLDGVGRRLPPDATVVAFTADHGEGMGEWNYWFTHGEYLTDGLVRVPLILRVPGRAPARRPDVAAHVDLLPTLLSLLAVDTPPGVRGRSLLADDGRSSRPYMAALKVGRVPRFGIVDDGYKLLVDAEPAGERTSLFRLGREDEDLAAADGARTAALRSRLDEVRSELDAPQPTRQPLAPEDRERMRALGYVTD